MSVTGTVHVHTVLTTPPIRLPGEPVDGAGKTIHPSQSSLLGTISQSNPTPAVANQDYPQHQIWTDHKFGGCLNMLVVE